MTEKRQKLQPFDKFRELASKILQTPKKDAEQAQNDEKEKPQKA